ncbi:MAG: glycosyltransferase, partial [Parvularculaceae bacterium]|nr:glycosyltransferase [Parvularculaceae bacterium]
HVVLSLDGDVTATRLFTTPVEARPFILRKSRGLDPDNLKRLSAAIRTSGAKVLCTYNFGALEAAVANLGSTRLPHIHQEDGFGPDETPARQKARRVWLRRFLLRGSTTVVPSETLRDVARRVWGLPAARIRYIPNGIELARFEASPRAPGRVVVGTVGAFRPEKNYARLLRAFAASGADADLVFVGDGPERESLVATAGALLPEGRARFPGRTDAPETAYRGFDIFALSSDTEQMPLSLMEAMAAGLPAVATDVGDVASMVSALNAPFIVKPSDEQGLAASIATLARDADLRRAVGAANRRRAEERFDLAAMTEAYRALYLNAALARR